MIVLGSDVCHDVWKRDPHVVFTELFNYKKDEYYPIGNSKEQKYVIRRRSARFLLDGKPWYLYRLNNPLIASSSSMANQNKIRVSSRLLTTTLFQ